MTTPPLPPDRGTVLSESRNPASMRLDTMSVRECVDLMNREDATVAAAVAAAAPAIAGFIEALEPRIRRGGRLIYIGAGTSGRLGVLDASECPPTFQSPPGQIIGIIAGGDSALRVSSEGREDDPDGAAPEFDRLVLTHGDTVLGIAAGGTTPYVLGGLALASRRGCTTGLLSCSPLSGRTPADHVIVVTTGPEVLTGSTRLKAGTATKLVLNTITTTLMVRLGKTFENLMVDLRATNEKLRDRAARIVSHLTGLDRSASFSALDHAGGSVKVAVVMVRRSVPKAEAEARLAASDGNLRAALS